MPAPGNHGILEEFLRYAIGGVSQRGAEATNAYGQFLKGLARDAITWTAVSASGMRCMLEVRGQSGEPHLCQGPAIGPCSACGGPTCMQHAMVSPGKIVCLGCVDAGRMHFAKEQVRTGKRWAPPAYEPPPAEQHQQQQRQEGPFTARDAKAAEERMFRRKHLKTLGLDIGALDDEIDHQYKTLAKKYHPDKHPEHMRAKATRKMASINDAYTWLKERRTE